MGVQSRQKLLEIARKFSDAREDGASDHAYLVVLQEKHRAVEEQFQELRVFPLAEVSARRRRLETGQDFKGRGDASRRRGAVGAADSHLKYKVRYI